MCAGRSAFAGFVFFPLPSPNSFLFLCDKNLQTHKGHTNHKANFFSALPLMRSVSVWILIVVPAVLKGIVLQECGFGQSVPHSLPLFASLALRIMKLCRDCVQIEQFRAALVWFLYLSDIFSCTQVNICNTCHTAPWWNKFSVF